MPPRGHSHTSHSSSHRSFRSSSSRSSGSRSSSFGSGRRGPSSHSSTTHTGSFSSSRSYTPAPRPRRNQPTGFVPISTVYTLSRLYGRSHDYVYYPNSWTAADGTYYEKGYYDEEGNRYNNVVIENEETVLTCEYCGTQTKVVWKEGQAPNCPSCGAPLKIDVTDRKQEGFRTDSGAAPGRKKAGIWGIMVAVMVISGIMTIFGRLAASPSYDYGETDTISVTDDSEGLYVEEIGRTCYLDGEDYYDSQTDCWFYFNEDAGVWQYWYEGISSDFGDYGWMEFDEAEDQWYIEQSYGNWIPLPDHYLEEYDYLWHIR